MEGGASVGNDASPLVMVRNRSCPAVSHICSLTVFPSRLSFLILKSILRHILSFTGSRGTAPHTAGSDGHVLAFGAPGNQASLTLLW